MASSGRRMVYPYTFTAKILQFPFKYYYQHNIFFRSWVWSGFILLPIMYKIQKGSFSPESVAKKEKRLKADYEEYLEHLKHLY